MEALPAVASGALRVLHPGVGPLGIAIYAAGAGMSYRRLRPKCSHQVTGPPVLTPSPPLHVCRRIQRGPIDTRVPRRPKRNLSQRGPMNTLTAGPP